MDTLEFYLDKTIQISTCIFITQRMCLSNNIKWLDEMACLIYSVCHLYLNFLTETLFGTMAQFNDGRGYFRNSGLTELMSYHNLCFQLGTNITNITLNFHPNYHNKENGYICMRDNSFKIVFWLPSEKRSTLKGKNLIPLEQIYSF